MLHKWNSKLPIIRNSISPSAVSQIEQNEFVQLNNLIICMKFSLKTFFTSRDNINCHNIKFIVYIIYITSLTLSLHLVLFLYLSAILSQCRFTTATSNDSTSADVKFILSPSTLTREISTSGILIRKNILLANMSSAITITTPRSISQHSTTTVGYFGNVHNLGMRGYKSLLSDESLKTKRSADKGITITPECEPFTIGNEAERTFNSPGYPGLYTKNISCVRVLEGESVVTLLFD